MEYGVNLPIYLANKIVLFPELGMRENPVGNPNEDVVDDRVKLCLGLYSRDCL